MKTILLSILTIFLFGCNDSNFQNGDIIFQTSLSSQSKAIQLATQSKYSHMGIIYKDGDETYVYEAVQPVKLTPLEKWIDRGKDNHFVVKRLKNHNEILTSNVLKKMKVIGEKFKGKDYDLYFEWSDERIYCSELVWKIYKEAANIEIGNLQRIMEFDLSHPVIQEKIKERYGAKLPKEELVISPGEMFNSEMLFTVYSN